MLSFYHLNPVCTPTEHFCLDSPSLDYTARVFPVEETDYCVLVPVSSLCNKCILMEFPSDNTYIAKMDVGLAFTSASSLFFLIFVAVHIHVVHIK